MKCHWTVELVSACGHKLPKKYLLQSCVSTEHIVEIRGQERREVPHLTSPASHVYWGTSSIPMTLGSESNHKNLYTFCALNMGTSVFSSTYQNSHEYLFYGLVGCLFFSSEQPSLPGNNKISQNVKRADKVTSDVVLISTCVIMPPVSLPPGWS